MTSKNPNFFEKQQALYEAARRSHTNYNMIVAEVEVEAEAEPGNYNIDISMLIDNVQTMGNNSRKSKT